MYFFNQTLLDAVGWCFCDRGGTGQRQPTGVGWPPQMFYSVCMDGVVVHMAPVDRCTVYVMIVLLLCFQLVSQEAMLSMIPQYGLLVELDKNGKVISTLHDPTGKQVPAVSEAEEKDGVLYLGSYDLPFLSRVYLHRK